jgi:DNA-directed RNA polymerase specialized sigma24 family protein
LLDARSANVLHLLIFQGRSAREAASELGITEGFAWTIKSRALGRLRKLAALPPANLAADDVL